MTFLIGRAVSMDFLRVSAIQATQQARQTQLQLTLWVERIALIVLRWTGKEINRSHGLYVLFSFLFFDCLLPAF